MKGRPIVYFGETLVAMSKCSGVSKVTLSTREYMRCHVLHSVEIRDLFICERPTNYHSVFHSETRVSLSPFTDLPSSLGLFIEF